MNTQNFLLDDLKQKKIPFYSAISSFPFENIFKKYKERSIKYNFISFSHTQCPFRMNIYRKQLKYLHDSNVIANVNFEWVGRVKKELNYNTSNILHFCQNKGRLK